MLMLSKKDQGIGLFFLVRLSSKSRGLTWENLRENKK